MTEFTSDVTLEDVVVRDTNVSNAVDEPVRAMLLDMLADRERTVSELDSALERRGYDRTENTIRHHVNQLRDAGLVEVARLEERGGATIKYYRANTIVLSYGVPDDRREDVAAMAADIAPEITGIVADLEDEYGDHIERIADEMAPCEHCRGQKYETYLLLTILRRGFVEGVVREQNGAADAGEKK
ncbi:ArsR/SmtB family transcription factor [Halobiforma nitratireducens]|uniref:Regulatory protein ArsR n=1 Tax=Halobiforma nitratireducens JCM 10879 TaxID=1227454 RepID=M0M7M3_9EURY|nr:winged helix-turn-helix domain-containing protein [Halobiforma nitratireducens]EMA41721.1 regulatory protein ArsR [Halobiforma nitratireducens JCM 10879]